MEGTKAWESVEPGAGLPADWPLGVADGYPEGGKDATSLPDRPNCRWLGAGHGAVIAMIQAA